VNYPNGSFDTEFHTPGDTRQDPARQRLRERYALQGEARRVMLRESERARFWYAVRVVLACMSGTVVGAIPMAWALHTTDLDRAEIGWKAGPIIGQSIIIIILIVAWRRWADESW
jgi:hypothetical protein